uniref:Uncharacterized protein n=1 Tax=Esox lucius TaxID=8010 RepID=A0A6Q2Z338_ESOLU
MGCVFRVIHIYTGSEAFALIVATERYHLKCFTLFSLILIKRTEISLLWKKQTIVRATLSGVMGPALTEIHKSSLLGLLFFFFFSDLAMAEPGLPLQQQARLVWRQQQQWQHTTREVRSTTMGRTPWSCLAVATLHKSQKKFKISSFMVHRKCVSDISSRGSSVWQ